MNNVVGMVLYLVFYGWLLIMTNTQTVGFFFCLRCLFDLCLSVLLSWSDVVWLNYVKQNKNELQWTIGRYNLFLNLKKKMWQKTKNVFKLTIFCTNLYALEVRLYLKWRYNILSTIQCLQLPTLVSTRNTNLTVYLSIWSLCQFQLFPLFSFK